MYNSQTQRFPTALRASVASEDGLDFGLAEIGRFRRTEALVIQSIDTFYIHTIAGTATPVTIYHTEQLNGQNILATMALSGVSQGVISSQEAGSVGASIKRWGQFIAPGDEQDVDPPPNPERNSVMIYGCTFITFELTAQMAEGIAVVTIYYFS
jgi:hypothetical protein